MIPETGMEASTVHILLNGERRPVAAGMPLLGLVRELGLPVQGVLVEYNGTALLRDEWPGVGLGEGDRVEILRVVAGG